MVSCRRNSHFANYSDMNMLDPVTTSSAFLVGLIGSTHCAGMCGGLVGAFSLGLPGTQTWTGRLLLLAAYNAGRLLTYTLLGFALGLAGSEILGAANREVAGVVGRWVTGLFTIALGLYLAGWWTALARLEQAGSSIWKRIEPFGRRLLPVRSPAQALGLGLVWGLLPCGMVYAALAWSLTSGSASAGAGLMLGFGLGTLPMMLLVGAAARGFGTMVKLPWVRRAAGMLVLLLGFYTILAPGGHAGHGAGAVEHVGHQ